MNQFTHKGITWVSAPGGKKIAWNTKISGCAIYIAYLSGHNWIFGCSQLDYHSIETKATSKEEAAEIAVITCFQKINSMYWDFYYKLNEGLDERHKRAL